MSRWLTVACIVLLAPAALQAQYPRARRGQFEVSGLDFRKDGGWRGRVARIPAGRHRLLPARGLGGAHGARPTGGAGRPGWGRNIIPVGPVAFPDAAPP